MTLESKLRALVAEWRDYAASTFKYMSNAESRAIEAAWRMRAKEDAAALEALLVQKPAKPTLPVGVSVLITNGDSVLLGERINNTASGLLSTPGGRVEVNEDIFKCAIRETLEETGLTLTRELLTVIAWREHFRFGDHYIMFYIHAPQSFGQLENREPEKCKGWEWHKVSEIAAEQTTEPLEILALLAERQPATDEVCFTCEGEQGLPATHSVKICARVRRRRGQWR